MILAMFAMVLLTFAVGIYALLARLKSVKAGQLSVKAFKLMQSEMPSLVVQTTRNFNNQFEVPVLFYTVCTLYLVVGNSSLWAIATAWLFVVSRCVHAFIHITYNHILHRLLAFWLGIMAVFALWLGLVISQL